MNGVTIPDVSAGSNHVGASATCTAQVTWPSGAATAAGASSSRVTRPTAKRRRRKRERGVMNPSRDAMTWREILAEIYRVVAGPRRDLGQPPTLLDGLGALSRLPL